MATALSPYIGYAATAEIAKEAVEQGASIRELVLERGLLDAATLDEILSVEAMTEDLGVTRPGGDDVTGTGGHDGDWRHATLSACGVPSRLRSWLFARRSRRGAAGAGPRRATRRLFPPEDLGLLEAPDRDAWQKPEQIMDALGIADGSAVADIGAGGGWFTLRLARRVGPNGLVYAQDIQRR